MNEGKIDLASIAKRVETLEANMDIALGRLNALHQFAIQVAADRENSTNQMAVNFLAATARVEADLIASPLPNAMVTEHLRVAGELASILRNAADGRQKPDQEGVPTGH